MINASKKLSLVTTSSTEIEVVSSRERFLKHTQFRYFYLIQGNNTKEDILFQDNKSYMQLCKNYPFSVGKGRKYVNAKYFFIVDKIEMKDIKMAYYPTKNMIANHSAKPT